MNSFKKFLLLLMLLFVTVFAVSCVILPGNTGEGGEKDESEENGGNEAPSTPENMIYNKTSELYVVFSDLASTESMVNDITMAILNHRDIPRSIPDTEERKEHEIVVGESSRQVSKTAKDRLLRLENNSDGDERYVIYSDGSSLAILYDGEIAMKTVLDILKEKYFISDTLTAKAGVLEEGIVNAIEYYEELDVADRNAQWERVEYAFRNQPNKDEIVKSLKNLYSIYSRSMIEWLANLYEPDLCVCTQLNGEETCKNTKYCGSGAFYYSNSGRDTLGYLPDVESTTQAITILNSAGLGGYSALTPEMEKKIGRFVLSLQESNGFFYHPQWGQEFTDTKISRRARDLNWSTNILNAFGLQPIYDTPNGIKGSGNVLTGATLPLGNSTVSLVSRVILVEAADQTPPHLATKEAFLEYLSGFNLLSGSYGAGNTISAQMSQILARDEALKKEGADYSLIDILIGWLDENMIDEVGHWNGVIDSQTGEITPVTNYFAVNGIMKISNIYSMAKREFPNAKKAAMAAADAITSDRQVGAVVDIYNTWYALDYLFNNITKYGSDKSSVNEIKAMLLDRGPKVIDATREKLTVFLKTDGSFSYTPKYSSSSSQGCPVAVPSSNEGDVNATNLANSTKVYLSNVLGFASPKPLGQAELYIFRSIVSELNSPVKTDPGKVVIEPGETSTFEDYSPGDKIDDDIYLSYQEGGKGGSIRVTEDPRDYRDGNVLKVASVSGAGEKVNSLLSNASPYADMYVFESEFCVESTDGTYMLQLIMESINMITFRVSGGKIRIFSSSSNTAANSVDQDLGIVVEKGQWFKLKLVCYQGTHDTFRCVVYFDGDLSDEVGEQVAAVTDNYLDKSGKKLTNGVGTPGTSFLFTSVYVMSNINAVMYMDNVNSYVGKGSYVKIEDPTLSFNVDAPDEPERIYDFEDSVLPEDMITEGDISVSNGEFILGGAASAIFPAANRTKKANASSAELDILIDSLPDSGDVLSLSFLDRSNELSPILGYRFAVMKEGNESYLYLYEYNGKAGKTVDGVRIREGEKVTLSVICFEKEKINLIFLNGEFITATESYYPDHSSKVFGNLKIEALSESASVSLDNLKAERNELSYEEAVEPVIPSSPFDFEEGIGSAVTSGGASVKNGALSLKGNGAKVLFTLNSRSPVPSAAVLEGKIKLLGSSSDGVLLTLGFEDTDGNTVFALAVVRRDGEYLLTEYDEKGDKTGPAVSLSIDGELLIKTVLYLDKGEAFVYLNGEIVMRTAALFAPSAAADGAEYGFVRTESSSEVILDDVISEALFIPYKKPAKDLTNDEDAAKEITFDTSSIGNLPAKVGTVLGQGAFISLPEVENGITKETTKALMLHTAEGNNDVLRMYTTEKMPSATCVTFEADIMIDTSKSGLVFQLCMDSNYKRAYMINVRASGGVVSMYDAANKGGALAATNTDITSNAANVGEWFNLKIEFYKGTSDTIRFKIYVNGEQVATSSNYYRDANGDAPINNVTGVYFYTMLTSNADIYVENFSIVEEAKTFTE